MIQIDMTMPRDCTECPLTYPKHDGSVTEYCCLTDVPEYIYRYGERPANCPLKEVIRCGKCRHYQGNHDVPGCAPCDFWGIGAVMWDDFCKRGEMWDE